jgi:hypothetical protein
VFQTEVLSGALLGPMIDPILKLDRANMAPILRASRLEFREAERLARLSDPETQVVATRAGCTLAAYVEFAPHKHEPHGIYVSSLQVAAGYRGGLALAHVLGRTGLVLRDQSPSSIRINVQRANGPALELFAKLGFRLLDAEPDAVTFEAVAGPELLTSPLLLRLTRRLLRAVV